MGVRPDDESGIKTLQKMVGTKADGKWGPKSQAKYDKWYEARVNADNNSAKVKSFEVNEGTVRDERLSPNPGTQRAYGNAPFPGLKPSYQEARLNAEPTMSNFSDNELLTPTTGLIDSQGNPVRDSQGMPIRTRF